VPLAVTLRPSIRGDVNGHLLYQWQGTCWPLVGRPVVFVGAQRWTLVRRVLQPYRRCRLCSQLQSASSVFPSVITLLCYNVSCGHSHGHTICCISGWRKTPQAILRWHYKSCLSGPEAIQQECTLLCTILMLHRSEGACGPLIEHNATDDVEWRGVQLLTFLAMVIKCRRMVRWPLDEFGSKKITPKGTGWLHSQSG